MHFPLALDIPSSIEKARSLQSHIHDMPEQDASVLLSLDAQYPVSIRGYALVSASSSPRWFPVYHFSEKLTSITVRSQGFSPLKTCILFFWRTVQANFLLVRCNFPDNLTIHVLIGYLKCSCPVSDFFFSEPLTQKSF